MDMFDKELAHYLDPKKADSIVFGTKNEYEFTMAALFVNNQWYVLVENADPSRITDINEIIKDEFDAEVRGWCVLKQFQGRHVIVPFNEGAENEELLTHRDGTSSVWLLKIQPLGESRLVH